MTTNIQVALSPNHYRHIVSINGRHAEKVAVTSHMEDKDLYRIVYRTDEESPFIHRKSDIPCTRTWEGWSHASIAGQLWFSLDAVRLAVYLLLVDFQIAVEL